MLFRQPWATVIMFMMASQMWPDIPGSMTVEMTERESSEAERTQPPSPPHRRLDSHLGPRVLIQPIAGCQRNKKIP